MISPLLFISILSAYFGALLFISWYTGRNANESGYFLGNKKSPWYAVAFGMLGDSLSGVTFISVPGAVAAQKFSYLQLVLGYIIGYWIIAGVLFPLYYKLKLTSIYSYLKTRFGPASEKTGSFFFLISRTLGAAARLYLAVGVIQIFIFDALGVPFAVSVSVIIVLILIYTLRGGIKTLVWTDTFQSLFLLLGVVFSIVAIASQLDWGPAEIISRISNSDYFHVFNWEWQSKAFFPKQFLGGVFIAVSMSGLDQNMMQKNLSMETSQDAQKNIRWFSVMMAIVNVFFLSLGALLYLYASEKGIALPAKGDDLFPMLALNHLGVFASVVFILGLTAATFSSADSVLTTLTTSFYIDVLNVDPKQTVFENKFKANLRYLIHGSFAVLLLLVILLIRELNSSAVIDTVLLIAGYTYGPLLGMFSFGILTKRDPKDYLVPLICLLSPALCFGVSRIPVQYIGGYQLGNEILILNGFFTFLGLWAISSSQKSQGTSSISRNSALQ